MRPPDSDERIRVRVNYVPRGHGLSLTISADASSGGAVKADITVDETTAHTTIEDAPDEIDLTDTERDVAQDEDALEPGSAASEGADDGYLTVVESGVTTLELRRADGQPSYLIWDESEVDWESLLAG